LLNPKVIANYIIRYLIQDCAFNTS